MSRESVALNVDSVATLPNGMVLTELESSRASSSVVANQVESTSGMSAHADSKEGMPLAGLAEERINYNLGYNSQPVIVNMSTAPDSQEQQLFNSGIAYLKQCNGISRSSGDQRRIDSPKRPANRNQTNRAWISQNGQQSAIDGHGQSINRSGRSTDFKVNMDAAHSRRNDMKWMPVSEKRNNTNDDQKQNLGEKKLVKILQRPSSVTKILGPDVAEQGRQEGDASTSTHQRKGRKKTLSLNPDELEDLEILIEQVLKDGIEETNTDSEDDDMVAETVGGGNAERKASLEKSAMSRNSDRAERELKTEPAKNSVIRNETGAKGRKFVKETGKNMGHGRDQGRRRENLKPKDNHRSGNFQPRRVNEVSPPTPTPVEDEKAKQNMTNVYPAQLKVALKHMDSLPPRFQRRLQTGMSQLSGSDPALSKLMEEISPLVDSRSVSSSGGKDGYKSKENREKGSRKSIRNLLNDLALYDDETALPVSDSFSRRLSYSSGTIGEQGNPSMLNAVQDSQLQSPDQIANGLSMDFGDATKSLSIGDPFRRRHPPIFQQKPIDKVFMVNGSYVVDPSTVDSTINYGKDFAQWHFDRSTTASPLPGTRKTTFSVNAPEFVSTMFPSSNPVANDELRGGRHVIPGSLECGPPHGFTNDANQMLVNQPLSSNMIGYRNHIGQPEYANVSMTGQPTQFSMIPGMPVTAGRNMGLDPSFGLMAPSGAMVAPRQRLMGMNMLPYSSLPMPYDTSGRGYVPQPQVLMPPMSNQPYVGTANMQMADQQLTTAASDLSAMHWYAGGTQSSYMNTPINQLDVGVGSMAPSGVQYGSQVEPDGVGGWQSKPFVQQPLPFEVGRQRIMRLMSEGNFVMVILVGRVDGNKLSMFSELPSNSTGSLVLNLRNGICPTSEEKLLEMHQWNYKQALEAIDARKNPVIIDHPFAQPWQMRDYIALAQMNNYFVEIVDCDDGNQFRGIPIHNMGSYMWDEWRPNMLPLLAVDESATSGGLNRYNIPSVMNSVYYPPSASSSSSLSSQQLVALGDQMSSSIQNAVLSVPNL